MFANDWYDREHRVEGWLEDWLEHQSLVAALPRYNREETGGGGGGGREQPSGCDESSPEDGEAMTTTRRPLNEANEGVEGRQDTQSESTHQNSINVPSYRIATDRDLDADQEGSAASAAAAAARKRKSSISLGSFGDEHIYGHDSGHGNGHSHEKLQSSRRSKRVHQGGLRRGIPSVSGAADLQQGMNQRHARALSESRNGNGDADSLSKWSSQSERTHQGPEDRLGCPVDRGAMHRGTQGRGCCPNGLPFRGVR
jgi:hypothetical protein